MPQAISIRVDLPEPRTGKATFDPRQSKLCRLRDMVDFHI